MSLKENRQSTGPYRETRITKDKKEKTKTKKRKEKENYRKRY